MENPCDESAGRAGRMRPATTRLYAWPAVALLSAAVAVGLAGCGGGGNAVTPPAQVGGGGGMVDSVPSFGPPKVAVTATRDGTISDKTLTVPTTGDTIAFTLFEPTHLVAGDSYPLVLNGPGYGGSRTTTAPAGSMIARLRDAGYYVITLDPRGFGASSGTVRVMDPDYYGRDMVAVLDWAENLPGLRRRANGAMVVGSYGGSYGGMYQLLLAGADPLHRLRVVAPDITPHDLNYALDENGVVKSGWGLALVGAGELPILSLVGGDPSAVAAALPQLFARLAAGEPTRQDSTVFETLIQAGLNNQFTPSGKNFFEYHSVNYFCAGQQPGPQTFILPTSVPDTFQVPPTAYPKLDALLTQGMKDTLFNYNNGYANYQCLKKAGGDVRLLSHQGGHILPVSIATVPTGSGGNLQQALDPFYAAINIPEFQGPGGASACGSISVEDADFAWFQQYLQGIAGAADAVITTGKNFCMSLADKDAIELKTIPHGGQSFTIDDSTPQLNSLLGVVGSLLGTQVRDKLLSVQPLYTAPEGGAIVAGIPTMNVNMADFTGINSGGCQTNLPLGIGGGCDPILYLAIGVLPKGSQDWQPVDAQYTPIRGFGEHDGDMNGISIRLQPGDQLGLLIYAFTAQYPITWSRDLLVPAVKLSGSVQVPFVDPADIVRQGV